MTEAVIMKKPVRYMITTSVMNELNLPTNLFELFIFIIYFDKVLVS